MNNLTINDWDDESPEITQILWRLSVGRDTLDGECRVRDGRVETPQLCEDGYVELRPCTTREIRAAVQQWLDDKPERDAENKRWEDRYNLVKAAWEEFEKENVIRYAIPSVDYLPTDPAAHGQVAFRITIWGEGDKREDFYFVKTDPTWGDVFTFFDRSIGMTGDEHHCYLEGAYHVGETEEGIPVYEFSTGS
jgi:hypothetical protein